MASSSSSSPPSSSPNSVINPTFTETKWLAQINSTLQLPDLQNLTETTTFSIFPIPESLKSTSPESYSPELIAVGPLHHFSPALFPMQTYKLAAAKRVHDLLDLPADFESSVERSFSRLVPRIRASYDKHLAVGDEAIAWIAAVDGMFVIDFLLGYCREDGRKVTGDKIRRDLVKLENQIPLFILKELASAAIGDDLARLMLEFARKVSPLDLHEGGYKKGMEFQHILDFVYQMIWLKEKWERFTPKMKEAVVNMTEEVVGELWEEAKNSDTIGLIQSVAKPVDRVIQVSKALGITERLRKAIGDDDDEQVHIPTASQLKAVGISFGCSKDGIRSFKYVASMEMLLLPSFEVKPGCEVLMKNLLAYESAAKSGSPVLNRYAQVMGCLVRTVGDVKLLREEWVIIAEEGESEETILEVFRGMASATASIDRKDKTVFDDHVKAVNEHYNGQRRIRMGKVVKKYLKVSWDVAKVMAALLLLVMLGIQTFCDVYKCKG